ncbi:MAG: hypothetical protein H6Q90_5870, partial [Deltaproteobacteria bacterium]|nr:hypothetical protein [Deltaproteobacteria bacterium]
EAEKADLKTQMDAMASLKKIKGTEFDRQYLQLMVDSHDKEIVRNDAAVATVSDSDLKTWLEARHTTLQRHVDAARELQKTSPQASTEPKTAPKP